MRKRETGGLAGEDIRALAACAFGKRKEVLKETAKEFKEFKEIKEKDLKEPKELKEGKLQVAVLPGVEYGWLRAHYPEARPLLVAINATTDLKAMILVAANSPAMSFFWITLQPATARPLR